MMFNHDIPELKRSLLPRLPELAVLLLPDRLMQCSAREIRFGNRGSLCINRVTGIFCDHESGKGGDLIELVQYARGGSFRDAVEWLRNFTSQTDSPSFHDGAFSIPEYNPVKNCEQRVRKSRSLWQQSESIEGTLAERYLREIRQLDYEEWPADIRFLPQAYHYKAAQRFPALIAALRNIEGKITAVHLIFLNPSTAEKANIAEGSSKLSIGVLSGAATRLQIGTVCDDQIALCEGLEDALAFMQLHQTPCWAVYGSGNFRSLKVDEHIKEVCIAADNDDAGIRAAQALAERLIFDGKHAVISLPPHGSKDWNEHLIKQKASAVTPASYERI